jgi:hypothetical protein
MRAILREVPHHSLGLARVISDTRQERKLLGPVVPLFLLIVALEFFAFH